MACLVAGCVACTLAGTLAEATTYNFSTSVTLDPSLLDYNSAYGWRYSQTISGTPMLDLRAGDIITGIISFDGGALSADGTLGQIGFDFFSQGYAGVSFHCMTELLGINGSISGENPFSATMWGNSVARAAWGSYGTQQSFSFTGASYTIYIDGITDVSQQETSALFNFSRVMATGSDVSVKAGNATSTVPEPGTMVLLGSGLLGLGGAVRRRKERSL